jgi:hypothetical protein
MVEISVISPCDASPFGRNSNEGMAYAPRMTHDSADTEPTLEPEQRRKLAVDLFNHVWTLLRTPDRTPEQDDEMIHASHASRYHWGEVGGTANSSRGEWQISRVYAVLGRPEPALYHARRCLAYAEPGVDVEDWDLPFAYEALARAHAVAGDLPGSRSFEDLARETGASIADGENRELLLADLATLPGR